MWQWYARARARTHTHTNPFNGYFPGLPRWAGTRKVKPIWILLEQETVSGSGISWAMYKSAPRSRQITMPQFFTGRMPFLPPNQQCQSTEGTKCDSDNMTEIEDLSICNIYNYYPLFSSLYAPSMLWRCWLGDRKGIRPVKKWVVGCWHGYLSGASCRLAYGPTDATSTHCLLLQ